MKSSMASEKMAAKIVRPYVVASPKIGKRRRSGRLQDIANILPVVQEEKRTDFIMNKATASKSSQPQEKKQDRNCKLVNLKLVEARRLQAAFKRRETTVGDVAPPELKEKKKKLVRNAGFTGGPAPIINPRWGPPYFFKSMDDYYSYRTILQETDFYYADTSNFPKDLVSSGYNGIYPPTLPVFPLPEGYGRISETQEEMEEMVHFAIKKQQHRSQDGGERLQFGRIKYCNRHYLGSHFHYRITFEATSLDTNQTSDYQARVLKGRGKMELQQFRPKPPSPYF